MRWPPPTCHAGHMPMRCLIVDDSAVFLRAARALLEPEGIAVTMASNSEEARRLIDEVDPDAVLVDIDLGNENGFDLAAELSGRTDGGGGPPRIIMISSHSPEDFDELVRDSPAVGFISKAARSARAIRSMVGEAS